MHNNGILWNIILILWQTTSATVEFQVVYELPISWKHFLNLLHEGFISKCYLLWAEYVKNWHELRAHSNLAGWRRQRRDFWRCGDFT